MNDLEVGAPSSDFLGFVAMLESGNELEHVHPDGDLRNRLFVFGRVLDKFGEFSAVA